MDTGVTRSPCKIRFVGVSEVTLDQLRHVRELVDVATVQNCFNYADRAAGDVLAVCEADELGFIPWFSLYRSMNVSVGRFRSAQSRIRPVIFIRDPGGPSRGLQTPEQRRFQRK